MGEQIYATLLLDDSYLPGALVLAHSLRDAGATKKLAVLVTLDAVSADAITQLKAIYHHVLSVPRIRNEQPANLYLMNRADLHSAFTKINLWKQTQFSKIVYIDADVVAYRAPDELFSLPHVFSAALDIGWPDIFNTGVMVLTPSMGDFYAMLAMAERGISFDGADQGLLNMYFARDFNRLPFTYNVTPSAHYQYLPAYRHFQSSISMVHFIGANKPWVAGRNAPRANSPYDEMVGRWWAVYDRHYRAQETSPQLAPSIQSDPLQDFATGPLQPRLAVAQPSPDGKSRQQGPCDSGAEFKAHRPQHPISTPTHHASSFSSPGSPAPIGLPSHPPHGHPAAAAWGAVDEEARSTHAALDTRGGKVVSPKGKSEPLPMPMKAWDAQRQPPPADSRPEAMNFPSTHYEMSQDTKPFVPPARYPSPPKNMWYQVPREPPAPSTNPPRPIFPWELNQPMSSRAFADEETPGLSSNTQDSTNEPSGELGAALASSSSALPYITGSCVAQTRGLPRTPPTPTAKVIPSNPWTSFPRINAWDDVPEIGHYVESLQKHRRVRSQGATGGPAGQLDFTGSGFAGSFGVKPRSLKLTDFPSEAERPSLPVTPAPIRRPSYWDRTAPEPGDGDAETQPLPAAEGVPVQSEWDPAEQLRKLAKQQSEALLRKLGGGRGNAEGSGHRKTPLGTLPFGSDTIKPSGHVAHSAPPSVLSPRPIKTEASTASLMREMDELDKPPATETMSSAGGCGSSASHATDTETAAAAL